jgi:hypothetical protein
MSWPELRFRLPAPVLRIGAGPRWLLRGARSIRLLRTKPVSEWLLLGTFLAYLCICVFLYFQFVQPWIAGSIDVRIGADSDRYWDAAKAMGGSGASDLVSLTSNFLGPSLIAATLKSGFSVMCFNVVLFGVAMKIAGTIPYLNKSMFGFLMLLNAELLPALTTLNKEILALLASVLIGKYFYSNPRSNIWLLLGLGVSFVARWEQAAILLLMIAVLHSPLAARPKLTILFLIALITVLYPVAFNFLGVDPGLFDAILANGNLIVKLNHLQDAYGFPIAVLPKILMTIAGKLSKPSYLLTGEFLNQDFADPQQDIFQPLGCLAFLVVLAWILLKRKVIMTNPIILLSVITMIITAVTPFIQPRYLYGTYVWLCLELALPARTQPIMALQECNTST